MSASEKRPVKMCIVTAQASTIAVLYRGQLEFLQENGFEITVVCSPTDDPDEIRSRGVRFHPVAIHRQITPLIDLVAIWKVWRFLRRERFDIVLADTPKGSLIGVTAAWLARSPLVVHIIQGLAYQGQRGLKLRLIRAAAWVACCFSHHVIAISPSLREFAASDSLCRYEKISVLGAGSSNGVDLKHYTLERLSEGAAIRSEHGIPPDALVIGFVGRLVGDKGINELLEAFENLCAKYDHLHLLILGTYEERDALSKRVRQTVEQSPRITRIDWLDDPVPYYAAMDMLTLPSYREGFGNVVIEASAMKVPVVASDIVGCCDSTADGVSGLLVPPRDAAALADALERLITDGELRRRLGEGGRKRVEREFEQTQLWRRYLAEYRRLLRTKSQPKHINLDASEKRPVKMCIVTAQASTIAILCRGQLEFLQENGIEITVVCSPIDDPDEIRSRGLRFHPVAIHRQITPLGDLVAIWKVRRFLRYERFDIVQADTPKGSLVGVTAARLAKVPLVIHLLRGLAYQRQRGLKRLLIKWAASIACRNADQIIAVSHGLQDLAERDGICGKTRIQVLGHGSSNGVDLTRFSLARLSEGSSIRRAHSIPHDAVVIGFVGRIVRDKGIVELADAFGALSQRHSNLYLLIIGAYEHRDVPPQRTRRILESTSRVVHVGWQKDTVPFYAAMDIVALPSYREGFVNVTLEAAAMKLPVVTSDTVGCRDGTLDGQTGLLVPIGDAAALTDALERLIVGADLRRKFGAAGRARVENQFDQRQLWPLYVQLYASLLREKCPHLKFELNPEGESA